jgi:hypothetical protein
MASTLAITPLRTTKFTINKRVIFNYVFITLSLGFD